MTQVSALAARNNVRVSTLDARGLNTDPRMQNLLDAQPTVANSDLVTLGTDTYTDVLTTLALETGGERDPQSQQPATRRSIGSRTITGTYYILGYSPAKSFDGRTGASR